MILSIFCFKIKRLRNIFIKSKIIDIKLVDFNLVLTKNHNFYWSIFSIQINLMNIKIVTIS